MKEATGMTADSLEHHEVTSLLSDCGVLAELLLAAPAEGYVIQ